MRAISEQAKTDAIEKFFNSEYTVYFEDIMKEIELAARSGLNYCAHKIKVPDNIYLVVKNKIIKDLQEKSFSIGEVKHSVIGIKW